MLRCIETRLLMGNEAIALGALRAGLHIACGYPGTPSSEILETVAREISSSPLAGEVGWGANKPYCEWSVNEKAAAETAAGAAIAGARVLVTMKQMGLNVAADPVMSINYVGIKGAMVIVVADDPGPISSQTEQDTRHFAEFAHIPVFDPSSPEEAYTMMEEAFALSEKLGRPVIVRPTTRVSHSYSSVQMLPAIEGLPVKGWTKDNGKWVIFPRASYLNHIKIVEQERELSHAEAQRRGVAVSRKGIATGGVSYTYVQEALKNTNEEYRLLKINQYPINENLVLDFLEGLDEVLVVEELDPVIEDNLFRICGKHHVSITIHGKHDKTVPAAGELSTDILIKTLCASAPPRELILPPLPPRPPVLCQGCPHHDSFTAVKDAVAEMGLADDAVYSGDIGCYTLGNTLGVTDTCLCMGAGITQAAGIHRAEKIRDANSKMVNFAFIGDSTFFASGVSGVINAVYNGADEIICVLDNSTTAMTGGQEHPGMGRTLMGKTVEKISIANIVKGCGVDHVETVNCRKHDEAVAVVKKMITKTGVRVIIFEGACVTYFGGKK
ncbi:MAG: indolepyruvate ferredoxin oxidoreductase subunit alpha [Spirochaetaceae bacterium]|nr:indolepyruvate ferredoxin oxidoreductase subunit alpha [Spirochaetaceae bacterium]